MATTVDDKKQAKNFKDKLAKVYKVNVIDAENLSQAATYKASLGRYLSVLMAIIFVSSILTAAFISFTPTKRLIPGYGDIEENKKYMELKKKIEELEAGVEVQQTYINGIQKMFDGELDRSTLSETIYEEPVSMKSKSAQIISETSIAESKSASGLNSTYFTSPVQGSVSSGFDIKTEHYGVDILAIKGAPIKAIAPGIVVNADWSLNAGNSISIQHSNNTISVYKHNSSLLKETGDYVKAGEAVAIIGNTGTLSDGPHLHLEIWYDGSPVNPENYITF